jgi:hypothetical protein
MLTGHSPYQGADVHKVYAHVYEPPPSLAEEVPGLAAAFDPVVRRAMAKEPADRYPSAGDLGRAAHAAAYGRQNTVPERTAAAGEAATGIAPTAPVASVRPTQMSATTPLSAPPAATQPAPYEPTTPIPAAAPPARSRRGPWGALGAGGCSACRCDRGSRRGGAESRRRLRRLLK